MADELSGRIQAVLIEAHDAWFAGLKGLNAHEIQYFPTPAEFTAKYLVKKLGLQAEVHTDYYSGPRGSDEVAAFEKSRIVGEWSKPVKV